MIMVASTALCLLWMIIHVDAANQRHPPSTTSSKVVHQRGRGQLYPKNKPKGSLQRNDNNNRKTLVKKISNDEKPLVFFDDMDDDDDWIHPTSLSPINSPSRTTDNNNNKPPLTPRPSSPPTIIEENSKLVASAVPSVGSTMMPSIGSSNEPSVSSSNTPSISSSTTPSISSSTKPSVSSSSAPSLRSSSTPSISSSNMPSISSSAKPSVGSSTTPSVSHSATPSMSSSATPSLSSSTTPSIRSSAQPSVSSSTTPSNMPSISSSTTPSIGSSNMPSVNRSTKPSISSSAKPSVRSSTAPSIRSSTMPSVSSSTKPSISSTTPSISSSTTPSITSSAKPSISSSTMPSLHTTTEGPSKQPSNKPSTNQPTKLQPTVVPTSQSSTSVVTSRSPTMSIGKDGNSNVDNGSSSDNNNTCPEGTCPNPNNRMLCQSKVECLIDPCEDNDNPCISGVCQVNYCGGCHAICVEDGNGTSTVDTVVEDDEGTTSTTQPSGNSTVVSLQPQPDERDESRPAAEETFNNNSAPELTATPKEVEIPKMSVTLIETSGVLSTQALEDVTLSIESFLSAQLDAHYNSNDKQYFSGIHLTVMDDALVARATPPTATQNDNGGRGGNLRRKLRQDSDGGEVVIGTELDINGVADFVNEVPPSPAEILSEIAQLGKRYNEYLISNITTSGNSELEDIYLVEMAYGKGDVDESMIENALPVQEEDDKYDGDGSEKGKNMVSEMKKEELGTEGSSPFIVIATVAGVALLTFLMFLFTSTRERSRSSLASGHNGISRGNTRALVTVPIKICTEGGSISGNSEEDEIGSDPVINCHRRGDSHISDLTTLASQPFARVVRTQSELDKDLESDGMHPIVDPRNQVETKQESEMNKCDEEEGNFVNKKSYSHDDEGNNVVRINSCYTQDYSNYYYNNSRSRSYDEHAQSNQEMVADRSYLPSGWQASHKGGFWNSITHYHQKSLESSIEESASGSTTGDNKLHSSDADDGLDSSQLSPHESTHTAPSFQREELDDEASCHGHAKSLESLNQAPSEESNHTSDSASAPKNETLSNEWLTAMHGDNTSITTPLPDSLQALEQSKSEASEDSASNNSASSTNDAQSMECPATTQKGNASIDSPQPGPNQSLQETSSEISEHSSSSSGKEKLSAEWLTAMHQGSNSVVTSQDAKLALAEKSCNEKSGGFLSSLDCDEEEEDSEPSVQIQTKRRTVDEDSSSSASSHEEKEDDQRQTQPAEETDIKMRDSADLLSLVDSIVGESMGPGPSLADLVWLEEKIREKDTASTNKTDRMSHLDDHA